MSQHSPHCSTDDRPVSEGLLILDYGSQYTLLIARRLRESGYYAEICDGQRQQPPQGFQFNGIILSGGPDSVSEESSRQLPQWVQQSGKPILGICYGMQLLAASYGAEITSGSSREYGRAQLKLIDSALRDPFLHAAKDGQLVWMSHGDSVHLKGDTFQTIAKSDDGATAVIKHHELPYYGLQFHPEVHHTTGGAGLLAAFAGDVCQAPQNWLDKDRLEHTIVSVKQAVGNGKVLMAVSGGVDSTVAVKVLCQALGQDKVVAVFVDNGLLRKNERQSVVENYRRIGLTNLVVLERSEVFLNALEKVSDPEKKRKIIGVTFIQEFEKYVNDHLEGITHLGQGTLYPDVIESAGHGAGSKVIKSHHNVGGLPDHLNLSLVEPFRYLFKDEVRRIGIDLGMPEDMVFRHPFPGPGLAVRVLGALDPESLDIAREADAIFMDGLRQHGLYEKTWQAFAVLLPVKTVGVMGDNRTYQRTCALRAVDAIDGMTASASSLPMDFLMKMADDIVRQVDGINRVVYDITSKPPGTIEWE